MPTHFFGPKRDLITVFLEGQINGCTVHGVKSVLFWDLKLLKISRIVLLNIIERWDFKYDAQKTLDKYHLNNIMRCCFFHDNNLCKEKQ